ncbi:MAG: dihydrolipoamide acetyltransferase family protein [Candidatus Berkiellales bacterium]
MKTFYLPDLGEGLPDGEIVKWHVKEGGIIKADGPLVAIETAKAVVEVPSPYEGKIVKLYAEEGDIVPTGSPLVDFELTTKEESKTVAGEIPVGKEVLTEKPISISSKGTGIKALPAVRALAKKLNIDLSTVTPTGPEGTITFDDVKNASKVQVAASPLEPLRGVRRTMAMVMTESQAEVVPVTVMDDADISSWGAESDYSVKLILAIIKACQTEPGLNSWFDSVAMARRLFSEIHLGIAVDTKDGLFAPVIHDAHQKSAIELRNELDLLKKEVQERSISPKKLQGATILLSNFGTFGGRYASPVVVPPMVATLGVGAYRLTPLVYESQIKVGVTLPLSLTFNHRVVTGGEATRFLTSLIRYLEVC